MKTQFSVKRSESERVCRDWQETGYILTLVDTVLAHYEKDDTLIFDAVYLRGPIVGPSFDGANLDEARIKREMDL